METDLNTAIIDFAGRESETVSIMFEGEERFAIKYNGFTVGTCFRANRDFAEIWINRKIYRAVLKSERFYVYFNGIKGEFRFVASESSEMEVHDPNGRLVAKIYVDDELAPEAEFPEKLMGLIHN